MAKALTHFSITRTDEGYLLSIDDQEGETTEFTVDEDQFDLMIEAIEEQLDVEGEDDGDDEDDGEHDDAHDKDDD
jgi:hypothetical protein